ncbi:MAG: hypothetical protein JNN08_00955, partial [Bryobacterales bacterium]|nr:hypothetical protein [Bryobacterales bacterium]
MLRRTFLPVLASPVLFGQEAQKGPQPGEIKVSVNEVIVPVTVTDEKDRFVSNLEEKDFTVLEEGKEQKIIYFNRERNQPVVVGFLLDVSNASRMHWKTFQEASLDLV